MSFHLKNEERQKESGRRSFLLAACGAVLASSAQAQGGLDSGGLTFRDFAVADNGASFNRTDPMLSGGPDPAPAKLLSIDNANGWARVYFESAKAEMALPLGWQATDDGDRGVGFSGDRKSRVLIWRVDFNFEGVRDAEHYAATKAGAIMARQRGIKATARKLPDGSFLIVYDNVPPSRGDSGPRTVFDVVMPKPGSTAEGALMTVGVPNANSDRGLGLTALLKSKVVVRW